MAKWRAPVKLPKISKRQHDEILEDLKSNQASLIAKGIDLQQIEDMSLYYRWHSSPRLICRVSRRVTSLFADAKFDDLTVEDIYLPGGIDVIQIIPEQDDPVCSHAMIFYRPTEAFPMHYLLTSDGSSSARLQVAKGIRLGDFDVPTDEELVDPRYLSLIASVGFIADNDEYGLMRHMVLSADQPKYDRARREADIETMRRLERKARGRNKNELVFDTFEMDLGEAISEPVNADAGGKGKSKRPHVRRGHFRMIRHGPGRSRVKAKWIPPVIVNSERLNDDEERLLRPNG